MAPGPDNHTTCTPPASDHPYADEQLEYLGQGPQAAGQGSGWGMSPTLRLRCPRCKGFITADPITYENCACGQLSKDPDYGRVGLGSNGRDDEIEVWKVIPLERIEGAEGLAEVLAQLSRLVASGSASRPWSAWFNADRRALCAGDRAGLRHLLDDNVNGFRSLRLYAGDDYHETSAHAVGANQRLDDLRSYALTLAARITSSFEPNN